MQKKKVKERMVHVTRANDNFDLKFWQKAGAQMRFKASWEMVKEAYKIKGKNGTKLRLQRHIQNIQQI